MTEQIAGPAEVITVPPPPVAGAISRPAEAESESPPESAGALLPPEPEPWPEPVDGAELLDQLVGAFERFVSLPHGAAEALALWVMFTHTFDAWESSPRLALTSPVPGCGKTTVLSLLSQLVRRPLPTSNITPAVVFRAIEQCQPTLLIDEADSFLSGNEQLRGILNSGHARRAAYVLRCVGDNYEPRRFSTWAPMAVAKIGKLPATLADRAIEIPMRRALPNEQIDRFRRKHEAELRVLAQKAARWAQDHLEDLVESDPEMPQALRNRAADNWRPLLGIADAAGGEWPEHARASMRALLGEEVREPSAGEQLLADLREIFGDNDRLESINVVVKLASLEERTWTDWNGSKKAITENQVAALLKPFSIRPKTIRVGKRTLRGYMREQLEDAWARFVPAENRNTETVQ